MASDDGSPDAKVLLHEGNGNGALNRRQFMKFCGAMAATLALPTR